ncbi:MAG: type II toxin-antitoxin system Phd/YefM family antitoxin [Lachnospiraceae bacterium]|nr:type II toxin-antitoxin system Phd/YefM family antitoxin [Lachnospiraceae bacterium]
MPQIMPIKELRNTNEISERCHAKREPIFITKNGYGDLVVMSVETYEDITATVEIDQAIAESELQISRGEKLLDAEKVFQNAGRERLEKV